LANLKEENEEETEKENRNLNLEALFKTEPNEFTDPLQIRTIPGTAPP